jgi:transcription antitermination factor NusG
MRYAVVVTRPQREFDCAAEMSAKFSSEDLGEFEVFLPVMKVKQFLRYTGNRSKGTPKQKAIEKLIPLFGNYLFVGFEREERWKGLRQFKFVTAVLKNNFEPMYVGEDMVQAMKSEEWFVDKTKKALNFKAGDRVRVKVGPFQGYEAVVTDKNRVDLMIFGQMTKMSVDQDWLERAK